VSPAPGFLVSLEGIDGAGKSTQVASLAGALRQRGHDVITVRPNDTQLGELLHGWMLQHQRDAAVAPWAEALLFNAERVQLLSELVLPALARGSARSHSIALERVPAAHIPADDAQPTRAHVLALR